MSAVSCPVRVGGIAAGLCLLVVALASATAAPPRNWQSLGASTDAGLEVFADSPGDSWCQESAAIKIVADDASVFADGAIDDMLLDVAVKLGDQCPQMIGFDVSGYVRHEAKAVYRAIAAREQGWEPMVGKAPTRTRVASSSAAASAASVTPPGGMTVQQLVTGNTLYGEVLPDALPKRRHQPARRTHLTERLTEPTRSTTIYFAEDGTWVERLSWTQRNREREQFLSGKWSVKGDRLCIRGDCFQLGKRKDGRIDLIGPDGKHYRRYEGSVPGDAESLVQAQAEYAAKVERSNQALAAFGAILALGIMNSGGGGGGGGTNDPCRDNPNLCSSPSYGSSSSSGGSYTAPIGGERGLYGSCHGVGPC